MPPITEAEKDAKFWSQEEFAFVHKLLINLDLLRDVGEAKDWSWPEFSAAMTKKFPNTPGITPHACFMLLSKFYLNLGRDWQPQTFEQGIPACLAVSPYWEGLERYSDANEHPYYLCETAYIVLRSREGRSAAEIVKGIQDIAVSQHWWREPYRQAKMASWYEVDPNGVLPTPLEFYMRLKQRRPDGYCWDDELTKARRALGIHIVT